MKYIINLLLVVILISSGKALQMSQLAFLEGIWKVENQETFETWEKTGITYTGHSFKETNGQKQILETLSIENREGQIIYHALVPDQNQGRTIPFVLNQDINDRLSFENEQHDFPKKIQYRKINETKIQVHVLGDDDKGFSYFLIKQ